jgi:hypothetical protein
VLVRGIERDDVVALAEPGVVEDGVDEVVEAGGSLRALPSVRKKMKEVLG